jgi:hypothetical protein
LNSRYDPPGVRPHRHLCGLNAAKILEVDIAWVSTALTVLAILRCFFEGRRPGIASSYRRWSRINQTAGWSTFYGDGTDAKRPRVRIRSGCSALFRCAGRAGQAALVPRPVGVKSSRRMARKIRRPLQFDKFLEDKQMTKFTFFKLLFAVLVAIGFTSVPGHAFAQRGGGFHGGGAGGGSFHGGGGGGGRPSGAPVRSSAAAARAGNFGTRSGNSMSAGSPGSSAVSANRALSHIDNSHYGTRSDVSSSFSGSHTNTSFSGSRFGNTTLATNHFSGATNTSFASGRSFSSISTESRNGFARVDGFRSDSIGGFRGGFGRGGRFRGGFGCFECGFGFGGFGFGAFGFGPFFDFGWGWAGFYGYDPFWYGSYSGFGYPYYPGSGYSGYSVANSDPDYSSSNQNLDGGYSFSANNNLGVAAPGTMMNGYSSAISDQRQQQL